MSRSEDKISLAKEITEKLFSLLGFSPPLSIVENKEKDIEVGLQMENPGILIGFHGETLSALGLILSLVLYKKTKKWTRINLNVGDYRERRQEQLHQMVQRIADAVKSTGQPQILPYLPASERRLVHLMLQNNPEVLSESEGEGRNRRVIIKPPKPTALI